MPYKDKADKAERWRQYRLENKEKISESAKKYYLENKEKIRNQQQEYKLLHPELNREQTRKYQALKKNAEYDGWTDAEVYARDNYTCQICFEPVPMDLPVGESYNPLYPNIDHIVGLAQGGSHLFDNVRLAHRVCNLQRTKEQERLGTL